MYLSAAYVSRIHCGGGDDDGVMWVAVATLLLCCFVFCSATRLLRSYDWLPGYTLYLLRCSDIKRNWHLSPLSPPLSLHSHDTMENSCIMGLCLVQTASV